MSNTQTQPEFIAFHGQICLQRGGLLEVAEQIHAFNSTHPEELVHCFDLSSGRLIDLPLAGSWPETETWINEHLAWALPKPAGRGRPKLGVVSREITLLPRQWQWLNEQPGGASATLRKLVDTAARDPQTERRGAQDATYRLANAIAGDLPGYEEAMRALYAPDQEAFRQIIGQWPEDVTSAVQQLAEPIWQ